MFDKRALYSLLPFVYCFLFFVLPWLLAFLIDRRVKQKRAAQGQPPPKIGFVKGLTWFYAVGFLVMMGVVLIPSLYNWRVHANVNLANNYARSVYYNAGYALAAADAQGETITDEYIIGRYADTGTAFEKQMHERAAEQGGQSLNGWYAVRLKPGTNSVEEAWFWGNALTMSELHPWDYDAQNAQAEKFGAPVTDIVGYYTTR